MSERFAWHEGAQLRDAGGTRLWPADPVKANGLVAIDDTDAGPALIAALAAAAAGAEFCVAPADRIAALGSSQPVPEHFQCLSSGTTGEPRRIRRSQASWLASFSENARLFSLTPRDRGAVLGRLSHSLSLYAACEALHLGMDLELLAGLRPGAQRRALAERGVSILYATPAQLRLLADARGPALGRLRLVLVGGGSFAGDLRKAVTAMAPGAQIVEFYGASETSFATLADAATPEGSVGRAYPGVTLSVRDGEGRMLPAGETGEVWVDSPYLFAGYAEGEPGDTRGGGAGVSVGEMGRLDTKGYLTLAGRKSRMVTIADQNVYPEAVEAILAGLPGIARVAVLARPDRLRGTVLDAAVLPGAGFDAQAVLSLARARLGPLQAPRRLHLCDDWPVLASGKPDLRALAARFAKADDGAGDG
ncbi:MAG: AMP-binding protein [Paracoccaceae bacterium]